MSFHGIHQWVKASTDNLFSITALCFPTHSCKCTSNSHRSACTRPPFYPYHPFHPHTSVVNVGESRGQETAWRSARGEADEGDGSCYRTEGNSVSFMSVWERQRGQCVWPGLVSSNPRSLPLSLSHSLSQELLLIKPVCFGRHTVALSSNTLPCMCARRCTCTTGLHAHPALFVLAVTRCHLLEPLNASDRTNTPPCLHLPWTHHPLMCIGTSNQAEYMGLSITSLSQ